MDRTRTAAALMSTPRFFYRPANWQLHFPAGLKATGI
jgi:hypothetical protein